MNKKYKITIDEQIRANIIDTRTSITMKAHELRITSNLGTGPLMQTISRMINDKIEDACKQIIVSIFTKSEDLHFVYSKSNLAYIQERLLETYPLEVTRMYSSELESKPNYKMGMHQLEVNKKVAIGNVKNTIDKNLKEYSRDKKMRRFSKETRVNNWIGISGIIVAIVAIVVSIIMG